MISAAKNIPTSAIRSPIKHLDNPLKHIEFPICFVLHPLYWAKKEEKAATEINAHKRTEDLALLITIQHASHTEGCVDY